MVLPIDILLENERIFPGKLPPSIDITIARYGMRRENVNVCILGCSAETSEALKISEMAIPRDSTIIDDSVKRYILVASTKKFDGYKRRSPRTNRAYSTGFPLTSCPGAVISSYPNTLQSVDVVVTRDGRFFLSEGVTLKTVYTPSWAVGDMTMTYERKIMSELCMIRRVFFGEEKNE